MVEDINEKWLNVHSLTLPENTEFGKRFNVVSKAFEDCKNSEYNTEEGKKLWDDYFSLKYCLEQGLPYMKIYKNERI